MASPVKTLRSLDQLVPGQRYLKWIVAGLPTLAMLFAAYSKLTISPELLANMKGIPQPELWLPRLGIITLVSVALYWIPQTSLIGTVLLTAYLGGAVATHLFLVQTSPAAPIVLAVLFWTGLGLRYPHLMAEAGLLPRR